MTVPRIPSALPLCCVLLLLAHQELGYQYSVQSRPAQQLVPTHEQVQATGGEDQGLSDAPHLHVRTVAGSQRHGVPLACRIVHDTHSWRSAQQLPA